MARNGLTGYKALAAAGALGVAGTLGGMFYRTGGVIYRLWNRPLQVKTFYKNESELDSVNIGLKYIESELPRLEKYKEELEKKKSSLEKAKEDMLSDTKLMKEIESEEPLRERWEKTPIEIVLWGLGGIASLSLGGLGLGLYNKRKIEQDQQTRNSPKIQSI